MHNQILFLDIPLTHGNIIRHLLSKNFANNTLDMPSNDIKFIQDNKNAKAISGHIPFYHDMNDVTWMTLLRHPADRLAEHFVYVRSSPDHYLHEKAINMTFEQYIKAKDMAPLELDNGMVRMLAGGKRFNADKKVNLTALNEAKKNLSNMLFGISEYIDESIAWFSHNIGLTNKDYQTYSYKNAVYHGARDIATMGNRDIAETENPYDLLLYEYALDLFKKNIESMGYDKILSVKLHNCGGHPVTKLPKGMDWGILQNEDELIPLLMSCREKGVKTVLEIGVYRFGLTRFMSEVMGWDVTAIDIKDFSQMPDSFEFISDGGVPRPEVPKGVTFIIGDSTLPETKAKLGDKRFDLVFIDGDHTKDVSMSDFDMYGDLADKIIAMHDIDPNGEFECKYTWEQVKKNTSWEVKEVIKNTGLGWLIKP